jgi:hypothetical protein
MKIINQTLALAAIMFILIQPTNGQMPVRAEIVLQNQTTDFAVVPEGKNGVLAYYINKDGGDKKSDNWTFIQYDTSLHKVWEKNFAMDKKKTYTGKTDFSEGVFYALYHSGSNPKYSLVTVDVATGKVEEFTDDMGKAMELSKLKVNNGIAYFIGDQKGHEGMVGVNLKTREKTNFAIDDCGKQVFAEYMNVNEPAGTLTVCFNSIDKTPKLTIKTISKEGKITGSLSIAEQTGDKELGVARVADINGSNTLLVGLYRDSKGSHWRGLYVAKYNGDIQEFIKYYNFLEFNGFFSYYSKEVKEEMEGKPADKKTLKREMDLGYNLVMHNFILRGDDVIFIGEAHYEVRNTLTVTNRSIVTGNNSSMGIGDQTQSMYAGEVFSHALVACFDLKGNKLWNNCFEMDNRVTPMSFWESVDIPPNIAVNADIKNIEMVCPTRDTIISKTIAGNKINDGRIIAYKSIRGDNDKIQSTGENDVVYWYGRNFIFSGFQDMKASYGKIGSFHFLNKLTYP